MIYWKNIILTFKEQSIAHFKTKVTKFVKISENEAVKNISNDSNQAQNKRSVPRVIKTFDYL